MNIFIILLGCNIYSILQNRLETSFRYIELISSNSIVEYSNDNYNVYKDLNLLYSKFESKTKLSGVDYSFNHLDMIKKKVNSPIKITWFLSGGIKNDSSGLKSEASIMKSLIDRYIQMKFSSDFLNTFMWDYVLDELSTNTAENFIRASDYLNKTSTTYDSIYVVTSDFHYARANLMIKQIDPSRNYQWILGDTELPDSRHWEKIHLTNVGSDVSKAFRLIR